MSESFTAYKIRSKETGMFSRGGDSRVWTKKGKTWSTIGHLKNHLAMFISKDGTKKGDYPYNNAEVVEIKVDYNECNRYSVDNLAFDMLETRAKKDAKNKKIHINWVREQELKQLEKLKRKYENEGDISS